MAAMKRGYRMRIEKKNRQIWAVAPVMAVWIILTIWNLCRPDMELSLSEKRTLAQCPKPDIASVKSKRFMSDFETYTMDQFPMREQLRACEAAIAIYGMGKKDNHSVYVKDGYTVKIEYPLDEASVRYACERFRFIYDTYLAQRECSFRIYVSVIPDKHYFLGKQNGYPVMDYAALVDIVQKQMDYAAYIDIMPLLKLSDYYKTDIHWRQERIVDVAGHLAARMGMPKEPYDISYRESELLLSKEMQVSMKEPLVFLKSGFMSRCRIFDYEENRKIDFYDREKAVVREPYALFLSGAKALITIENPDGVAGRELVLFRDSFGSSIAPLLAAGYKKVTIVDIRYLSPSLLGRLITFDGQDILFLYSVSVLNHSETLK